MKKFSLFTVTLILFMYYPLNLISQGAGEIEPNDELNGNCNPIITTNGSYYGSVPWDTLYLFGDIDIWKICPGSSGLLSIFLLIVPDGSQVSGGLYESDSPDYLGTFLGSSGDYELFDDKYYFLYTAGNEPILPGAVNGYSWQLSGDAFDTLGCLPEGITFTAQAQIDNFQTNYPGCIIIEGDVEISGSDINNLNGLNVLISIGGTLIIEFNDALTNLTGLNNITFVGESLAIYDNYSLTNLTGLDNVFSIGENLWFYSNDALTSFTGLENLTSIGGDLWIYGNDALTGLTGLDNVTSIGGGFELGYNATLTSLAGWENLTYLGYLWIYNNNALASLSGLDNMSSIEGNLSINNNYSLTSLTELNNVTYVGGNVTISDNVALTNLIGLNNLTSIGGYLSIWNNDALISLTGLDNLTSIAGDLSVFYNDGLISLTGLDNISSIGGTLAINSNTALYSLIGLENINHNSIAELQIFYNPSLSICNVQSICDYLADPNGTIIISYNADGCNSQAQVMEACLTSIEEYIAEDEISLFPNPAKNTITVLVNGESQIEEITIYNQLGQKVLVGRLENNSLNVSKLQQGMYIIEVVLKNCKIREILIVK